jgi:phage gpG-like protein
MDVLSFSVSGADQVIAQLAALPGNLLGTLANQSGLLTRQLVQTIVDEKLSGQVLQSHTNRLKDAVTSATDTDDASVTATVSVDGVPYAAIQEYGGTTKAHVIAAVNGKALAFAFQGKQAFFARIQHPGSVIPERSFLRSALEEAADQILAGFLQALVDAVG